MKNRTAISIRERLRNYLEFADDQKVKAIYTLVEEDLENNNHLEYPDELKAQLDNAEEYYNKGGKMVTQAEMQRRLKRVLKADKKI